MREKKSATASLRKELYRRAVLDAFKKLDPRHQVRNPVMFVTEVGSLLTTILWIQALAGKGEAPARFHRCDRPLAVVHRPVCQFLRSAG